MHWSAEPVNLQIIELPMNIPGDKIEIGDRYLRIWHHENGSFCDLSTLHLDAMPVSLEDVRKSINSSLHSSFGHTHWSSI